MMPGVDYMTAGQLNRREWGVFKFVKVNGEYRFGDSELSIGHVDMVDVQEGEKAVAAGTILLFDAYWRLEDSYSTTLRIGCGDEEVEELKALIARPNKSKD
jgi:hypothetical protein